jgi:organic radical activating enzyme
MPNYDDEARSTREKLNQISPTMCMAKWLQVSLHLPQGRTHSCYHPPTHSIPLGELKVNPNALHNTMFKMKERKQMLEGKRPSGCQYCWNVEDAPNPPPEGRLSDRHYRSSEWWIKDAWDEVVSNPWDHDIKPRYVEVNFNQACNFKCSYCSPHLSTAWEDDVKQHGPFKFSIGQNHNEIKSLEKSGLMPLEVAQKDNPYVDAFWKWWPEVYPNLKVFRMTGGEPLMDKNTFKVFDYVKKNPNPDLEISLTSNMCPPDDKLMDKFIEKVKALEEPIINEFDTGRQDITKEEFLSEPHPDKRKIVFYVQDPKDGSHWKTWPQKIVHETLQGIFIESIAPGTETIRFKDIKQKFTALGPCDDAGDNSFTYAANYERDPEYKNWVHKYENVHCKHISVFVSLDSVGKQAEYIRDGLDFEKMKANIERLLSETKYVSVSFINTFTMLSVPGLRGFLEYMLELREKYGYDYQVVNQYRTFKQRIWFDIPYLRYPDWMTIQLCDEDLLDEIQSCIDFMKENVLSDTEYGLSYKGFKNYEVLKLERDLAWAREGYKMPDLDLSDRLVKFYEYFTEYDKRRGKRFLKTFPQFREFWWEAKEEKRLRNGQKTLGR